MVKPDGVRPEHNYTVVNILIGIFKKTLFKLCIIFLPLGAVVLWTAMSGHGNKTSYSPSDNYSVPATQAPIYTPEPTVDPTAEMKVKLIGEDRVQGYGAKYSDDELWTMALKTCEDLLNGVPWKTLQSKDMNTMGLQTEAVYFVCPEFKDLIIAE
jgi:hypothetical protein